MASKRLFSFPAFCVESEVDHHDGIFLHDADQQNDADQRDDTEIGPADHQREQRADSR